MPYVYNDTPIGFHRLNKAPLDDTEIFNNVTDLYTYINSGAVYQGQRCLVKLPYYDQEVIIRKSKSSNKLMPIMILPTGYEYITKKYGNDTYIMIYYYNGGSAFTSLSQQVRFTDSLGWAMLPQADIIAGGTLTNTYLLEYNTGTTDTVSTFSQYNFATHTVSLISGNNITNISSTANSSGFFTTAKSNVVIMPKAHNDVIVRLWVKGNDYYNAMGLG